MEPKKGRIIMQMPKQTQSTKAAAAAHTLGLEFIKCRNIYTEENPFRNADTPGEVTYDVAPVSNQFRDLKAEDVFRHFANPGGATARMLKFVEALNPADRDELMQILPLYIAEYLAAFADTWEKMATVWKSVNPKKKIVRPAEVERIGGENVDRTETIVVELNPSEETKEEWDVE